MNTSVKHKVFNLLLILTSFLGYLEWGGNNRLFLFEAETEIVSKLLTNPLSVIHPFIILPLIGQLLLLITLFQKTPGKVITYSAISGLGALLGFMFVIGIISLNIKTILSVIPFLATAIWTIWYIRSIKEKH
ncbi:MAG: hypothetical protein HY062_16875 [Bacteroidetes bacterium]|nr:hypothetical protein [Bacteroidota bacterium]